MVTETEQALETVNPYALFTTECKGFIKALIRTGNYPHLCSNTNRTSDVPVDQYRARVNILGRRPDLKHTGERNLNAGDLEIVLIVTGVFRDVNDFRQGMKFGEPNHHYSGVRYVIGDKLKKPRAAFDVLSNNFWSSSESLHSKLELGDYESFTKLAVQLADRGVGQFKASYEIFKDVPLL